MNGEVIIGLLGVLFVGLLIYVPFVWFIVKYAPLQLLTKVLYSLTAPALCLVLLIINIMLVDRFLPGKGPQVPPARPFLDRGPGLLAVILPVSGSWLWYRFFTWLNRLLDWEQPEPPDKPPSAHA